MYIRQYFSSLRTSEGLLGSGADPAFYPLTDPKIRKRVDDMAEHGFNAGRGKDPLGVAISREGKILKVNKGLHRLAMAQHLGLPSVPVQVCHIHRDWWNKITAGTTGEEALLKMQKALSSCTPEESSGPLDQNN